jgi:hypothetical protein
VVAGWRARPGLPTVLHEPYWETPPPGYRQNTDPWVFGDQFIYSNCKQHPLPSLRDLPVGSLVLFGSARQPDFVLDTVFVVAGRLGTFRPSDPRPDLAVDEAFATCTIGSVATGDAKCASTRFTVYRGATFAEPVDGTFSFTPSVFRAAGNRFARPPIDLPGIVNPRSAQSPKGAGDRRPHREVIGAWRSVVEQVHAAGLELGVRFATPPRLG